MRALNFFSHILSAGGRPLAGFVGLIAALSSLSGPAVADAGRTILRDAEVENIIRADADPLFRAAGVPPDAVKIRIISDSSLNAFVTVGNRMFIHSGLLIKTENPNQLTGVIAHETGHIVGGHMVRMVDEIAKAQMTSLLSMALGTAAAVATGRGDVGMATAAAGQNFAMKNFFSYSRNQEASADAFALKVLNQTSQSAKGLLDFFKTLQGQEYLAAARQDPYVRTHPLTEDRIENVRNAVEQSSIPATIPPDAQLRHDRMVAKLFGFLEPQPRVLQRYPETDTSIPSRYARAIAYYRRGNLDKALPLIDSLIAEAPNDPYFHELRGQMLVESSRVAEGLPSYAKARSLAPKEPLIAISYGHALTESGNPADLVKAQAVLREALRAEPDNSFGWQLLGTALGRSGDENRASYALAEYALLVGEYGQALYHAEKASRALGQKDPLWLRLQDILERARALQDEERKNR